VKDEFETIACDGETSKSNPCSAGECAGMVGDTVNLIVCAAEQGFAFDLRCQRAPQVSIDKALPHKGKCRFILTPPLPLNAEGLYW